MAGAFDETSRARRYPWLPAAALLGAVSLILGMSAPQATPSRILAIGDSLTHGGTASPGHRWVDLVGAIDAGRDGYTSADALTYPWVIPDSVDIVLVEFGVNDYLRGVPAAVFEANMRNLLARLPKRIVLIAAPVPLDPRASVEPWANYVLAMRRLGQVIDIGTFGPELFIPDGVHPNDAGYAVMAGIIGKGLAAVPTQVGAPGPGSVSPWPLPG